MIKIKLYMKPILIVFKTVVSFMLIFISTNIKSQNIEIPDQTKNNKPDVHINVNRELDNNGNVIRYDSTYTWSWSNNGNQNMNGKFFTDSTNSKFSNHLGNTDLLNDPFFKSFSFSNDTTNNHILNNSNFDAMQQQMIEMMQRQQQMINEMFNQQQISPIPEKNNNQNSEPEKKHTGNGIDI